MLAQDVQNAEEDVTDAKDAATKASGGTAPPPAQGSAGVADAAVARDGFDCPSVVGLPGAAGAQLLSWPAYDL